MPVKKRSSVFKWGCLSIVLLIAVVGVAAYLGIRSTLPSVVERYTDKSPVELPHTIASKEDLKKTIDKVNDFKAALKKDGPIEPLVLNEHEINQLLKQYSDRLEKFGQIYVDIKDDRITGQISLPLDEFGKIGQSRYFNGSASVKIGMTDDRLVLFADNLAVKGDPVPDLIMNAIRSRNLAGRLGEMPEIKEILERLDAIKVADGQLHMIPRQ